MKIYIHYFFFVYFILYIQYKYINDKCDVAGIWPISLADYSNISPKFYCNTLTEAGIAIGNNLFVKIHK